MSVQNQPHNKKSNILFVGDLPKVHQSLLHQGVESMAKSLIMTKYNLDYDYFKNNTIVRSKSSRKAV